MKLYLTTLFLSVAAVSAGRRRRRRGLSKDEQFHRKMQSFSEDPLVSENHLNGIKHSVLPFVLVSWFVVYF